MPSTLYIQRLRIYLLSSLFILLSCTALYAQQLQGSVTDAKSGVPIVGANIIYEGRNIATKTDAQGRFTLPYIQGKVYVLALGYYEVLLPTPQDLTPMNVLLESNGKLQLKETVVTAKKQRYTRKNNPAVALMQRVIKAKKQSNLEQNDYYSFKEYQKITFSANDIGEKSFDDPKFKSLGFLKEHVETNPVTGKRILPISISETVSKHIFRKESNTKKTIIEGQRSTGINDFFNTGDVLTTVLKDAFTNINIYDDDIRVLQALFVSPLSSKGAIAFYRYFITDTTLVAGEPLIEVSFTPNNPQDFGFTGSIFVLNDGTYRVRRASLGIPRQSDVNFVKKMMVKQEYTTLPTGVQALVNDEMIVELSLAKFLQQFQVERITEYTDYSFDEIPNKAFKIQGPTLIQPDAMMRNADYWAKRRPLPLSQSEGKMDQLVDQLSKVKGFKIVLLGIKALVENFVETGTSYKDKNYVDIGPVNTMVTTNYVDGLRLRLSAQTTADLSPHLFAKGYIAHGFKDHRWKGMGEFTYSFNKKAYLPREYPVNNLTLGYQRDVMAPSDLFMPTDKDNVFTSLKWTKVEQMVYFDKVYLQYDREWAGGLRFTTKFKRERMESATNEFFFQRLSTAVAPVNNKQLHKRYLTTAEILASLRYQPGAVYINSKQRRIVANNDAPIFTLAHTMGVKGLLGGEYNYNFTEASIYKRFQLLSWGRINMHLKGGVQWNQVPFPLLIMPAANLSFIIEDGTFSLIDNMEFLNDRYASLMASWDLNGKIFNRIPLLKKLKWREFIGVNMLWGQLSSKNNPFAAKNAENHQLFFFPGYFDANGHYVYTSTMMKHTPYVEAIVGIHNIFKLFHIEYVRRLTYLDNPDTSRWGIRFMFRVTF